MPEAVQRGCVVVDESGFWRMNPKVPLVIPEVQASVDQHVRQELHDLSVYLAECVGLDRPPAVVSA